MTACSRAADGFVATATETDQQVEPTRTVRQSLAACKVGASQFVSDVMAGMRRVSHNALAMLGLTAVLAVASLIGRPDMRHELEGQALSWLMERANLHIVTAADEAATENGDLLAIAEPEAIQRATAANPAELNRQQSAVAYWISRRYNVAPEPISRLVQEAWSVGARMDLEPTLVLAVMAIESGFNPFAQSHVGAQGLMQVMTRIHHDKYEIFGGQNAAFDPVTNLRVGVQVLKDCIRKAGSLEGGLKYYVGAANLVDDGGYAAKVLTEQGYLRQVAAGHKTPVNAPLPPAVVVQADVSSRGVVSATPVNAVSGPVMSSPVSVVPSPAAPAASETAMLPNTTVARPHPDQVALLTM